MESNIHSVGSPAWLTALAAAVDELAAQDLEGLADAALVLALRRLLDRLDGHWLKELVAVDDPGRRRARLGPAGRLHRRLAPGRLRMGASATSGWVRTSRALDRGP